MTRVKGLLAAAVAAAGLMAFAEGEISITLNRVQQRYPWNGMVDIDYTVAGVPEPANYFVKFTATTDAGVKYVAHEMLDASTLINASNGTYRVTWVATAEGATFQDCAEFFTKNAKYKAELVYSGSDKSQIPYPYYVVIDVSDGAAATSYPVAYEYFANTHLATNKYNTAEYKTDKIVLRKIHACTFTMGSPADEVGRELQTSSNNNKETQHEVTLSDDYYVGMFPITQQQWMNVTGTNPSYYKGDGATICPVEEVTYKMIRGTTKGIDVSLLPKGDVDADSFIGILRDKSGLTDLDLPSEAQWENAARAGTKTSTFFGNNVTNNMTGAEIGKYMWHTGVSGGQTHGVGQVIPNQWGLYDVLGNVLEICLDRVATAPDDDWGTDPVTDPLRATANGKVIVRGGYYSGDAIRARSAARDSQPTTAGANTWRGFRLAMHAPVKQQMDCVQLWENGPIFATCNVGAEKPEDYGWYFWWGDTVGYTNTGSAWISVKDGTTITFDDNAPANSSSHKTVADLQSAGYIDDESNPFLKATHDAARANLDAPWRMMTEDELDKLVDPTVCTREWKENYNGSGVNGFLFRGAVDPYSNNEVFFPAAGLGTGAVNGYPDSTYGNYWISRPSSNENQAYYMSFRTDREPYKSKNSRHGGRPVRAVRDAK